MKGRPHVLLTASLMSLVCSSPAHSDPVMITGGFLVSTGRFQVSPPGPRR